MERNNRVNKAFSPNPTPNARAVERASPMARFKRGVIDKVSDVLSYPARRKAQKAILKADRDVRDIKMVREARNAEPIPNDYRSPLFRARANVSNLKYDADQRARKIQHQALKSY